MITPAAAQSVSRQAEREGKRGLCFADMNWIRVAVAIGDDPDIHELAARLNVPVAQAVGLVVCTLARFPEHAPDGDLTQLRDSLLERWAGWDGERGQYATELRDIFLTDGIWASWEKHNGAAMRDSAAARKRAADYRRMNAERLAESTANGTPNGTPNGSLLRTNERTNLTTGGRKRLFHNEPEPYIPPPFCKQCGGGMGKRDANKLKMVIIHRDDCPNANL